MEQSLVSVTSRPGEHLALFTDRRAGEPATYVARVAADGTVQDPAGVLLTESLLVAVVATDTGYLAAWAECEAPYSPSCEIVLATLQAGASGLKVDARVLVTTEHPATVSLVRVGAEFLLLWQATYHGFGTGGSAGSGGAVFKAPAAVAAVLDSQGTVLQGPSPAGVAVDGVVLVGSPSGALLLGRKFDGLFVQRVSLAPGVSFSPEQKLVPGATHSGLRAVYGDGTIAVLTGAPLTLLRLDAKGSVLGATALGDATWGRSLAFVDGAFRVAAGDATLHEWTVTADGVATEVPLSEPWTSQRLWTEQPGGGSALFATSPVLPWVGYAVKPAVEPAPLTRHGLPQLAATVSSHAGRAAVAWTEATAQARGVQLAGGANLSQGAVDFVAHAGDVAPGLWNPAVRVCEAAAGTLVTWFELTAPDTIRLRAMRRGPDGAAIDAAPLPIATSVAPGATVGVNSVDVAPSPLGWTLVYRFDWANGGNPVEICVVDVPASGSPSQRGCIQGGFRPSISAVDGGHLVAWWAGGEVPAFFTGLRLGPGEAPTWQTSGAGGATSGLPVLETSSEGQTISAVVSDGSRALAPSRYLSGRPGATLFDVSTAKVLRPRFPLADETAVDGPVAAFVGEHYWVAWRGKPPAGALRVVRVDRDGQPVGQVATVAEVGRAWPGLSLAPAPGGALLVATPLDQQLGSARVKLLPLLAP